MNASTAVVPSSAGARSTRAFWEHLWLNGIQFVICFVIVYPIYANQPQVGASPDELVAFYAGNQTRILIAAIFSSLGILPGLAIEFAYPIARRTNMTPQTDTKVQ